ncbi:MAG TPA: hypothetical protein VHM66_08440 [Solirubrobacterales bacterium]|jgi:hypothetical protein|nr:hypothetical protein [Solirubrobacterales bacterium]
MTDGDLRGMVAGTQRGGSITETTITLTLSRPDAEVLLGVLSAERYNPGVEAVCDAVREQIDELLGGPGDG